MSNDAWGYVRLSQQGRDASLEEQKKQIREYASRNDLNLQTTRNDGENTSGFNEDREEYQLLRGKAESDDIDAIIVRDRARLSRDFDERLRWILLLREEDRDVELHVIEAGGFVDVTDVQTAAMEAIHAMTDHIKKMMEIERSRKAVEKRMEEGYDHGPPRFGMEYRDDGKYQVPSEDFETVREIWRMYESDKSLGAIERRTGVPKTTVKRVIEHREWYETRAGMAD